MGKFLLSGMLGLLLLLATAGASAVCKTDAIGAVYCAEIPHGGAEVNGIGSVECGRGECVVNSLGLVKCSKVVGGGAAIDGSGIAKCFGGCANGSRNLCVSATP